jgi:XTP/dITP diphosphohydrolase
MAKVVLATGNQGKVDEMQASLQEYGFEIFPQSEFGTPEAIEDGLTFVENAIIKARNACQFSELPAIADDSGLEVDALHGAPGIYSARYADGAGDGANNLKLLQELENVEDRHARFVCVLVYLRHTNDPNPIISRGVWEGEIAHSLMGENGFGYDPLFYVPEQRCHSAELEPTTKKRISHRGQALSALKQQLSMHSTS